MVKIVYESKVAKFLGVDGLVLYPFVLLPKTKEDTDEVVVKHVFTHVEQIERDGVCAFYFSYLKGLVHWGSVEKTAAQRSRFLQKAAPKTIYKSFTGLINNRLADIVSILYHKFNHIL